MPFLPLLAETILKPRFRGKSLGPRFFGRMKLLSQLAFGLFIFPALSLANQGVQILLPGDHVSTAFPYIHIVGRSTYSEVVIELNGIEIASPVVQDSVFHSRISLPFGLNHVVVKPRGIVVEEFDSVARVEVLCGPQIPQSYSKLFVPHQFHDKNSPLACMDCHSKDRFREEIKQDLMWCESCHQVTGNQFKKHVLSDKRDCTGCHRIADDLTLTVSGQFSDINPCFGCHSDKIGQYAQNFIHGPVAGGSCTICHNPHGSAYENNLRSPVPFLCMSCHTGQEVGKARVNHKPFADGAVQIHGRGQVVAKGFFHHQAGPPFLLYLLMIQPGLAQQCGHRAIERRRQGQVEDAAAVDIVVLLQAV